MSSFTSKIAFLGCALDADERQDSIDRKRAVAGRGGGDPYEEVMALLRPGLEPGCFRELGSLEVPGWLRPIPPAAALDELVLDNFVRFIDGDGCREYAARVSKTVEGLEPGEAPCLICVDHSLAGGAMAALAGRLGAGDVTVVMLDAHLDAVPISVMAGAIEYDMETNPQSLHDPNDPFLRGRADSYNASSFVHYLLAEGVIEPRNLFLVGPADYPPKRALRLKDKRIRAYTGVWSGLRPRGVRLITKDDVLKSPGKLALLFKQIKTPHVYVSIDMDVGARAAVEGVRFTDWQGLNQAVLLRLGREIRKLVDRGVALAGLDVCEFNPRAMGPHRRTYQLAADLIGQICYGWEPS